jgi:hypothetical protein
VLGDHGEHLVEPTRGLDKLDERGAQLGRLVAIRLLRRIGFGPGDNALLLGNGIVERRNMLVEPQRLVYRPRQQLASLGIVLDMRCIGMSFALALQLGTTMPLTLATRDQLIEHTTLGGDIEGMFAC